MSFFFDKQRSTIFSLYVFLLLPYKSETQSSEWGWGRMEYGGKPMYSDKKDSTILQQSDKGFGGEKTITQL